MDPEAYSKFLLDSAGIIAGLVQSDLVTTERALKRFLVAYNQYD